MLKDFWKWHRKVTKNISKRNREHVVFGKALIFYGLGSIFSIQLVQYGYIMLIVSTILLGGYLY
ncbi:MAG: hypothetical protein GOV15_02810, partial [Candidatus Diapherotrites archaeon]|nr:hypothetical protein [Candidatus Diapherotrites archaeon]